MNPMTNVRNIEKLNEEVLRQGVTDKETWHGQYKDSAWVFIGGLPYDLTEGDIICVFSQYGEIVDINLVREKKTGKTKGFCFLCYEDQRSTILCVDNLNGIKLGGRTIRVDHCDNYRRPKSEEVDESGQKKEIISKGCAPKTPSPSPSESETESPPVKRKKKSKKTKKLKAKDRKHLSSSGSEEEYERRGGNGPPDIHGQAKQLERGNKHKNVETKQRGFDNIRGSDNPEYGYSKTQRDNDFGHKEMGRTENRKGRDNERRDQEDDFNYRDNEKRDRDSRYSGRGDYDDRKYKSERTDRKYDSSRDNDSKYNRQQRDKYSSRDYDRS